MSWDDLEWSKKILNHVDFVITPKDITVINSVWVMCLLQYRVLDSYVVCPNFHLIYSPKTVAFFTLRDK